MHRRLVRVLAGAAAVTPLLGTPAVHAQDATYTMRVKGPSVTALGDWRTLRDPSIADATAVFGAPASREPLGDVSCRVRWTVPRFTVVFTDFGANPDDQCSDTRGKAQTFTTRDPAFRTMRGLGPGMAGRLILKRHPRTVVRNRMYWLYTARVPGTTGRSGILGVRQEEGRVGRVRGYIGAAGE